jgi:hypothetical protein
VNGDPPFVQIAITVGPFGLEIVSLDAEGRVWRFEWKSKLWHPFPSARTATLDRAPRLPEERAE